MPTYTLTGNANWSDIKASVNNDDEVALAGYALTIDEQPTQTGISVTTVGTAGTVSISGEWNLSTWSFTAGTVALIETAPAGCEIGAVTGGSASNAYGCGNNFGTITTSTGGSSTNAYGCNVNYGTITTATGGSATSAHGCTNNFGTITTSTGGSASRAYGCSTNYGTITTATGVSADRSYGCNNNYGQVFGATDDVAVAVYMTRGSVKFVDGPAFKSKITTEANFDPLQTLYVLNGTLSAEAVIPEGVEVINLFGSRPRIYVGGRLRT